MSIRNLSLKDLWPSLQCWIKGSLLFLCLLAAAPGCDVVSVQPPYTKGGHNAKLLIPGSGDQNLRKRPEYLRAVQQPCPAVGAIRWDAWHGDDSKIGLSVEKTLGPQQWHYRIPFCGRVQEDGSVDIECDSAQVMKQEIRYAAEAGLNYWAFLAYDRDSAMSRSFNLYFASPNKKKVHLSLISQFGRWRKKNHARSNYFVEMFKNPAYQLVHGNRPLLFVYKIKERRLRKVWGSDASFRKEIAKLRHDTKAAGLGNPYIVVMDGNPERAQQLADRFGFDAISAYAEQPKKAEAPYGALAKHDRTYWKRSKGTGAQVVPIVMAGWDDRPRAENPAARHMKRLKTLGRFYYAPPTPKELAEHLSEAIHWSEDNATSAGPNPIIIYAWNENDEGGWLVPTLSEGTARVEALGKAISEVCRPAN